MKSILTSNQISSIAQAFLKRVDSISKYDIESLLEDLYSNIYYAKSGIKIKKKNKGKFTDWCGGTVTDECIRKGKKSKSSVIRKRATFTDNVRKWSK